jgi:hypothetical protein
MRSYETADFIYNPLHYLARFILFDMLVDTDEFDNFRDARERYGLQRVQLHRWRQRRATKRPSSANLTVQSPVIWEISVQEPFRLKPFPSNVRSGMALTMRLPYSLDEVKVGRFFLSYRPREKNAACGPHFHDYICCKLLYLPC